MALAVASSTTVSATGTGTLTINKPSGVAAGDLLLIGLSVQNATADPSCTGFTICAQQNQNNSGGLPDVSTYLLYRIADSSDVSASTYTIDDNTGSSTMGNAAMLRVTGWTTTNPVYQSAGTGGYADPVTGASLGSLSLARPSSSLMLLLTGFHDNNSPRSPFSTSGYSVTSGESNPTWTEVFDSTVEINGGTAALGFSIAYANSTSTTNVTAFSETITSNANGGEDGYSALFVILCEPKDSTGSSTLLSADADSFLHQARYLTIVTDPVTNIDLFPLGNGTHTMTLDLVGSSRGFVFDTVTHAHPGMVSPISSGYTEFVEESGTYTDDSFGLSLTDYSEGTTMYVRSFIQIPEGYVYGNEVTFDSIAFPEVNRWYPNGEGTINSIPQLGNQGNVYSIVRYLPELSTVRKMVIYCAPTTGTASTVIATAKVYINQKQTATITKQITQAEAARGYVTLDLNTPNVNAVQVEIEFNTTDALGGNDFAPSVGILEYDTSTTHSPSSV